MIASKSTVRPLEGFLFYYIWLIIFALEDDNTARTPSGKSAQTDAEASTRIPTEQGPATVSARGNTSKVESGAALTELDDTVLGDTSLPIPNNGEASPVSQSTAVEIGQISSPDTIELQEAEVPSSCAPKYSGSISVDTQQQIDKLIK